MNGPLRALRWAVDALVIAIKCVIWLACLALVIALAMTFSNSMPK